MATTQAKTIQPHIDYLREHVDILHARSEDLTEKNFTNNHSVRSSLHAAKKMEPVTHPLLSLSLHSDVDWRSSDDPTISQLLSKVTEALDGLEIVQGKGISATTDQVADEYELLRRLDDALCCQYQERGDILMDSLYADGAKSKELRTFELEDEYMNEQSVGWEPIDGIVNSDKSKNNITLVPRGYWNEETIPRINYQTFEEESVTETALAPITNKYLNSRYFSSKAARSQHEQVTLFTYENELSLDSLEYLKRHELVNPLPRTQTAFSEEELPSYIPPVPRERPVPKPRPFVEPEAKPQEGDWHKERTKRFLPRNIGKKNIYGRGVDCI